MAKLQVVIVFLSAAVAAFSLNVGPKDVKAAVTVQATNNTQVPSVTYIVNAVECLEEAYGIYDNDADRSELYAALFEEKHPGKWNVVVGYTAYYLNSSIFVETLVSAGGKDKFSSSSSSELFLLFSSD